MGKLIAFVLLFVGALVFINACTNLNATTVGHIGGWRMSGAFLVAGVLAWVFAPRGK
jgi:hypothetical protein